MIQLWISEPNELSRRSSLFRHYVKGFRDDTTENPFNDEMAEQESVISSVVYDMPKRPDKSITWEECMK